jgi:hypothetical protein
VGHLFEIQCVPVLKIDNKSAIQSIKNQEASPASKHISIRYHFIRDEANQKRVMIEWCAPAEQLDDTKPLPRVLFEHQPTALGLVSK